MATLETQYKWYLAYNPETPTMTFEEWKVDLGKRLQEAISKAQDELDKKTI